MNNRLNEYLTIVETRLRPLPPIDREQELAEIAQHLDNLIAARQTEGQTEDAATVDAIAQFGAAHEVGKRLYQTGKHKRFAPLLEVGLFGAAASTLFWLADQAVLRLWQAFSPPSTGYVIDRVATHWPLLSWPISWSIGLASLAVLILRYGARGVWQKGREQTPIGAAVRWQFITYLVGTSPSWLLLNWQLGSFPMLPPIKQTEVIVLSNALSLTIAFITAYFVGRGSKSRESVADAVGCVIAVGAATGLLQMTFQFVPVPWVHVAPTPFSDNVPFYLLCFFAVAVVGALRFFVARQGVQMGEKARHLPNRAKQTV